MRLCVVLFAVAGVIMLAGCGTTRTVTRTVYVKPCASNQAMTRCLGEIVNASRRFEHLSPAVVSCHRTGGNRYGCVARIDGGCYRALVERTASGAASFLSTALEDPKRCDELIGAA
jgi:uncharacterized protein YgiB involved in biofilm formation